MGRECVEPELFTTVTHDTFRQAMKLLGVDVDNLLAVSIGDWTPADTDLFPLAPIMEQQGSFWRVRTTMHREVRPFSNIDVRFIGIERPVYDEIEEAP